MPVQQQQHDASNLNALRQFPYAGSADIKGVLVDTLVAKHNEIRELDAPADVKRISMIHTQCEKVTKKQSLLPFHDTLRSCSARFAALAEDPRNMNAELVPVECLQQLIRSMAMQWPRVTEHRQHVEQLSAKLATGLRELEEELLRAAQSCEVAQPLIRSDDKTKQSQGWDQSWTWHRRAEVSWGLGTLLQGLRKRNKFHDEIRSRIDRCDNLLHDAASVKQSAERLREVTLGVPVGCNVAAIDDAEEKHKQLARRIARDISSLQREAGVLQELDIIWETYYEERENGLWRKEPQPSGGARRAGPPPMDGKIFVALTEEEERLRLQMKDIPGARERALRPLRERIAELQQEREEEIARQAARSRDFMAHNDRLQADARDDLRKCEEYWEGRGAVLEGEIEMVAGQVRQLEEERRATAADRNSFERDRHNRIQTLKECTAKWVQRMELTNKAALVELEGMRCVRETSASLANQLRTQVNGTTAVLNRIEEDTDSAQVHINVKLTECITSLVQSLEGTSQDIEELLPPTRAHLQFLEETADPDLTRCSEVHHAMVTCLERCREEEQELRGRLAQIGFGQETMHSAVSHNSSYPASMTVSAADSPSHAQYTSAPLSAPTVLPSLRTCGRGGRNVSPSHLMTSSGMLSSPRISQACKAPPLPVDGQLLTASADGLSQQPTPSAKSGHSCMAGSAGRYVEFSRHLPSTLPQLRRGAAPKSSLLAPSMQTRVMRRQLHSPQPQRPAKLATGELPAADYGRGAAAADVPQLPSQPVTCDMLQ